MAMHPTFIHAAADLHRQALLAAAADASRSSSPGERTTRMRRERRIRRMVENVAGIAGRIIDDFEPSAGQRFRDAQRLGR